MAMLGIELGSPDPKASQQARSQGPRNDEARNMASAGARAYMGVWGLCPQWGPGAKPLVRGSGGLRPPEADAFLYLQV